MSNLAQDTRCLRFIVSIARLIIPRQFRWLNQYDYYENLAYITLSKAAIMRSVRLASWRFPTLCIISVALRLSTGNKNMADCGVCKRRIPTPTAARNRV